MVPVAPVVCKVPKTMCPVSAAVMAVSMVSKSLISPTSITSGPVATPGEWPRRTWDVHTQLALVDRRFFVRVIKFDRILDGNNVMVESIVDVIDHCRQRCCFAGTRRPVTKNNPRGRAHKSTTTGGVPKALKSNNCWGSAAVLSPRAPFPCRWKHEIGPYRRKRIQVRSAYFLQFLLAPLRCNTFHQSHRIFRLQNLGFQPVKMPVYTYNRGCPALMCKSLALRFTTVCKSLSMRMVPIGTVFQGVKD